MYRLILYHRMLMIQLLQDLQRFRERKKNIKSMREKSWVMVKGRLDSRETLSPNSGRDGEDRADEAFQNARRLKGEKAKKRFKIQQKQSKNTK